MACQRRNRNDETLTKPFAHWSDCQLATPLAAAGAGAQTRTQTRHGERAMVTGHASTLLRAPVDGFAALAALNTGKALGWINTIHCTDAKLPFCGVNALGDGRAPGTLGIHEFVNKPLVRSGHLVAPG